MLFKKNMIAGNDLYRDIGHDRKRPFVIFATSLQTPLGDLISRIVFFCTVKDQFDHAQLHVCYRNARPYSRDVISLAPNIDKAEIIKGELPAWLLGRKGVERFWRPLFFDFRMGGNHPFYDLVVSDWMADSRNVHALPNPIPLRIPPDREPALKQRMIELGLEENHWFAVIHYRESNYEWRPNISDERNSDPEAFRLVADHIIDDLGGQVVRLGHPGMHPFPERPGLVDLSAEPDGFMLQAYASSRARFLLVGPTGPSALGFGFHVPTAIVDATDAQGGWGDMEQVILTKTVVTEEHGPLRNRDLLDADLLSRRRLRELDAHDLKACTAEELAAVADHLFAHSKEATGWRGPKALRTDPRPNTLAWPPVCGENLNFIDV